MKKTKPEKLNIGEHKRQRQLEAEADVLRARELEIDLKEMGPNYFRVERCGEVVTYYPKMKKWQHRGRMYKGNADDLYAFLVKWRMMV